MPLNVPAGYWQTKLRWRLDGDPQEMICTLGVAPTEAGMRDPNELANAIYNAWQAAFEPPSLCTGWYFVGVDTFTGGEGGADVVGTWAEITPGTNGDPPLPQNCAALVRKRTVSAGRANVGRMFLPAGYLAENGVSATGQISTELLVLRQSQLDAFYVNIRDTVPVVGDPLADVDPWLYHNDPGAPPTRITAFQIQPIIATQRRRLRR